MPDIQLVTLSVTGMSCQHCVQRVKDALEAVDGVSAAEVDLDAEQAAVTHDGSASRDQLADAIAEAGYDVPAAA